MTAQYGEAVTLTRPGAINDSTYPPTRGASQTFTFDAVPSKPSFTDTATGNTQAGDVMLLLSQGQTIPTTNDKITYAGNEYSIVAVKAIRVQGGDAAYKVTARNG